MELEVKILGFDLDELEKRVIDNGGEYKGIERQKNIYFNLKDHHLGEDEQLRIRITKYEDESIKREFTFKKNLTNSVLRENIELNTLINDEKDLYETLKFMGYEEIRVGYKTRKTYILDNQRVEFDEWDKETFPYAYSEIEVENEEKLKEILEKLAIDNKYVSTKSIEDLIKEKE